MCRSMTRWSSWPVRGLISDMLTRTLSGHVPPTAIFSSNSRTSIEMIPILQQLGRTDLAMVGFGDFPMASALHPAVSVIDQNPSRLGRAAAERASQPSQPVAGYVRTPHCLSGEPHPQSIVSVDRGISGT